MQFAKALAMLILKAESLGYNVTLGPPQAKHMEGSLHYCSLAMDLNLFQDGTWLTRTVDHLPLGLYWESLGGSWGGRFNQPDGNHYSFSYGGKK